MLVLGIETSCDETAVSIVENGKKIHSSVVSSSLNFHKRYNGVIPEIASRMHLETISTVFEDALAGARVSLKDIKLIAVTKRPGLPGCLRVGICFAQALSFAKNIPLVNVDHLHAHLYAGFFNKHKPSFPFVGLVVSGGHTSLFYVKNFSQIELIGLTQDDACGEAFDKVATILGLGYPGGPVIEKLANSGDSKKIKFRCSNTKQALNFSFSGIKTAVLYYIQGSPRLKQKKTTLGLLPKTGFASGIPLSIKRDVAASFQQAVVDALVKKSITACKLKKVKQLVVGGGVAANNRLRDVFLQQARENDLDVCFSPKELCTDNAVMVAGLGYQLRLR